MLAVGFPALLSPPEPLRITVRDKAPDYESDDRQGDQDVQDVLNRGDADFEFACHCLAPSLKKFP